MTKAKAQGSAWSVGERITLVVTNIIKLAGLFLAIRTALQLHPMIATLAIAAFMMAGAQFSEEVLVALGRRFFGQLEKEAPAEAAPRDPKRVRKL